MENIMMYDVRVRIENISGCDERRGRKISYDER